MGNKQFQEGHRAFFDGIGLNKNPYREGTQKFLDWENGWLTAEAESIC